ncbi:MAG: sulfite exporter TauE/SafE family protein [Actinobacteria bacterium]|nr:sulfite exporter TauE/SafE family protein [Actinomycetota bacterium]
MSEVCTTGVSGISHFSFRNVKKEYFLRLLLPGVLGGVLGAYLLADVLDGARVKPFISLYLLFMGFTILYKAFRRASARTAERTLFLSGLGVAGGFCDALGGGGWGPIVTSTLVARGNHPRFVIGSVNASEFFVTLAQSVTFFLTVKEIDWRIILGLVIGGVMAAPLSAYTVRKVSMRPLMLLVGCLVVGLNLRTIIPYILRAF